MRGAQRADGQEHATNGIIPACAGSTQMQDAMPDASAGSSPHVRGAPPRLAAALPGARDHPRMCGEHRAVGVDVVRAEGIIPACAGSTMIESYNGRRRRGSSPHVRGAPWRGLSARTPARDHPRMCGEHRRWFGEHRDSRGIIPACAGSTNALGIHSPSRLGSSPHVRGARSSRPTAMAVSRIIPACAGSTLPPRASC